MLPEVVVLTFWTVYAILICESLQIGGGGVNVRDATEKGVD